MLSNSVKIGMVDLLRVLRISIYGFCAVVCLFNHLQMSSRWSDYQWFKLLQICYISQTEALDSYKLIAKDYQRQCVTNWYSWSNLSLQNYGNHSFPSNAVLCVLVSCTRLAQDTRTISYIRANMQEKPVCSPNRSLRQRLPECMLLEAKNILRYLDSLRFGGYGLQVIPSFSVPYSASLWTLCPKRLMRRVWTQK